MRPDCEEPPFLPPPEVMAVAVLLALLLACLWSHWVPVARGAPAPFPRARPRPDRGLEQARKSLTGHWAMCWQCRTPGYAAAFSADGHYLAQDSETIYEGDWRLERLGEGLVLVVRERQVFSQSAGWSCLRSTPLATFRIQLRADDPRRGLFETGSPFRLQTTWEGEEDTLDAP